MSNVRPQEETLPPTTKKLTIAAALLDRALGRYYEGNSNFAALHLAGGADGLLGKHLNASGRESSFESLRNAAVLLSKYVSEDRTDSAPKAIAAVMNHAKNATKHMDGQSNGEVHFDARSEAHGCVPASFDVKRVNGICATLDPPPLRRKSVAHLRRSVTHGKQERKKLPTRQLPPTTLQCIIYFPSTLFFACDEPSAHLDPNPRL